MQRLDQNFVDSDMRRLRQRPQHGGCNIACVQPHIPVLAALSKLSASGFVGGAGRNLAVRVAGLNARDLYTASCAFLPQTLADTLNKELGARVPMQNEVKSGD